MLLRGKILFKPQNWVSIRGGAQSQGNDESRRRTRIAGLARKYLMYSAALQAIAKDPVNGAVAEVKGGALRGMRIRLTERRNVAPQRRKIDGCHYGNLSMFMICSIMESDGGKSQEGCMRLS